MDRIVAHFRMTEIRDGGETGELSVRRYQGGDIAVPAILLRIQIEPGLSELGDVGHRGRGRLHGLESDVRRIGRETDSAACRMPVQAGYALVCRVCHSGIHSMKRAWLRRMIESVDRKRCFPDVQPDKIVSLDVRLHSQILIDVFNAHGISLVFSVNLPRLAVCYR